jgi:hypothetical protein
MPLEWTHEKCRKPACDGTTSCPGFPTVQDRINMAGAAYREFAESDGTSVIDFALDVLLFTKSEHASDKMLLPRLTKQAGREWAKSKQLRSSWASTSASKK